jgi:hypothetical protein
VAGAAPPWQIGHNFQRFLHLLVAQDDRAIFNVIPGFGFGYPFYMPVALFGLVIHVQQIGRLKRYESRIVLSVWLLAAMLLGFVYVSPNVNQLNILFMPLILLSAIALGTLLRWTPNRWPRAGQGATTVVLLIYLASFGGFIRTYFTSFPARAGPAFFEGFGSAILFAEKRTAGPVCVTDRVNMPYIFVLFYTRTDPGTFLSTVKWENPAAMFRRAASFGRYAFGPRNCPAAPDRAFILHRSEIPGRVPAGYEVARFKEYAAIVPRPTS